jgi:hypothetical protein
LVFLLLFDFYDEVAKIWRRAVELTVPTLQRIGGQRGSLAPLLLITLFWANGCQSLATQSEGTVGSDTRWKITGQAGRVSLRSPGQSFWHRAIPGVRIAPDSQVATFDGSHLELASAGDEVTASGPSRFTLPNTEQNGVWVRQDAGTLRYKVQNAPKRRFEVKTPHFSTVVKGTKFLVSIDRTSSEVFVDEGRVLILDPNGEPLGELTAGQTGRMAAHPGATLEVSAPSDPSFERSMEPAAGTEPSLHGNIASPHTTNVTSTSLGSASISEAREPTADLSLVERIGSAVGDLAARLSSSAALTSGDVNLGNDRGGGAREQERQSNAGNRFDGSRDNKDDNGKGGKSKDGKTEGNGKGKGKSKDGKGEGNGNGKGKGKGKSKDGKGEGKGDGKGKGHGHGRGKGADGRGAHMILDGDDRGHLIAWNERR